MQFSSYELLFVFEVLQVHPIIAPCPSSEIGLRKAIRIQATVCLTVKSENAVLWTLKETACYEVRSVSCD